MRAKNMHMGATIYQAQRTIFITGAIDTNDCKIKVRIQVPEAGVWQVIKAETNLTNEAWSAWQVGLGFKNVIPETSLLPICRQFAQGVNLPDSNRIIFFNGDIRPGEPILKSFQVELEEGATELCLNHSRILKSRFKTEGLSVEEVAAEFDKMRNPEIEIIVPSLVVDGEQNGFVIPELEYAL